MAFRKAEMRTAFLKAGFFGDSGSGKSWTASEIAIGLHRLIKSKKPVGFVDSEGGSDYLIKKFSDAKIGLEVDRTRAFATLCDDLKAASKDYDILIVDSITHFWQELMAAWKKKRGRSFISLRDWGPLKDEWNKGWAKPFIDSKLHIIVCGRSGNIYEAEDIMDPKSGEKSTEMHAVDTKMKAEGEFAYEPSLLVEMHVRPGDQHVAVVRKDRFGIINGKEFVDPGFNTFLPYIKLLNLGGDHEGISNEDSTGMFEDPDRSWTEKKRLQQIHAEEIEGALVAAFPGQTKEEKVAKANILQVVFNSRSWTSITQRHPDELAIGERLVKGLCTAFRENREPIDPETFNMVEWLTSRRDEILEDIRRETDDDIPDFQLPAVN